MKWFFAINEESLNHDPDWVDLIKVAVLSAKKNTSLEPHMIYDGENFDLEIIKWIKHQGVAIHKHKLSFTTPFLEKYPMLKGAYLRTELVEILKKENIPDEFVLYTDCDVMFLQDLKLEKIKPEYFAVSVERDRKNFSDINTGVMILNVNNLYKTLPEFKKFILEKKAKFLTHDQEAYKQFYKDKWNHLPFKYNWKPYWEINPDAKIIHFHGIKHTHYERLLNKEKNFNKLLFYLANLNTNSYYKYTKKAREFLDKEISSRI